MVRVNLIPEKERLARARVRRLLGWAAAITVSLAAVAVAGGMDWLGRVEAEALRADQGRLRHELGAVQEELVTLTLTSRELVAQIGRAKALHEKRAWSAMIAMIASHLPTGAWLVSLETDPVAPIGATIRPSAVRSSTGDDRPDHVIIDAPRVLRIDGYAVRAADPITFATALRDQGIFRKVTLAQSQREPLLDQAYYHFEVVCGW